MSRSESTFDRCRSQSDGNGTRRVPSKKAKLVDKVDEILDADDSNALFPEYEATELLPNFLYLGGKPVACDLQMLKKLKITNVVNCAAWSLESPYPGDINYLPFKGQDHEGFEMSKYIPKAMDFIDEARAKGERVLVHCMRGINRSGFISVAYLVHSGWDLVAAAGHAKRLRICVLSNRSFRVQLRQYEAQVNSRKNALKKFVGTVRQKLGLRCRKAAGSSQKGKSPLNNRRRSRSPHSRSLKHSKNRSTNNNCSSARKPKRKSSGRKTRPSASRRSKKSPNHRLLKPKPNCRKNNSRRTSSKRSNTGRKSAESRKSATGVNKNSSKSRRTGRTVRKSSSTNRRSLKRCASKRRTSSR